MNELAELLRELWTVRRRLLPVVLGLCFGTLGLSVLLAFGSGFDVAMRSSLARSGEAMLRWYQGSTSRPWQGLPAGRALPLTMREAELLRQAPGVVAASPEAQLNGRIVAGSGDSQRSTNAVIIAVGDQWATVRGREVAPGGRFLSPRDIAERRAVVVLGEQLAQSLFQRIDVIGRTVVLFDSPFTVVGILPDATMFMNYGGADAQKAIVPISTAQAMRGFRILSYVLVRIDDPNLGRTREAEQRAMLAGSLRFDPNDRSAARLSNHAVTSGEIRGIVTGTRLFLFLIGTLGLLVAAVGVANMTFVMVEERTQEIGLRMALGATPGQIRSRQMLETLVVVAISGGLGLGIAAVLLWAVNLLPLDPTAKGYLGDPLLKASTALTTTVLLGLCAGIAGWHPAARAAQVQPMEALRHD